MLFDEGTFTEIDALVLPRHGHYLGRKTSRYEDGVVTGYGFRSELKTASDPDAHRIQLVKEYEAKSNNPYVAPHVA